jgi:NADH:ubiquinone oxidoreductase subunit K
MTVSLFSIAVVGLLGLLAIGLYGLLTGGNIIRLIVALQIMVKAALLGLVVAGRLNGQMNLSQSLAITVIVADTIVAVVGLGLAVQVQRRIGTLNVRDLARLRG